MPRKLPPYCERWRDRHGKLRLYFRRGKGRRIPLPITIGSDEFNTAYESALVGGIEVKHNRRERELPGTIAALINSYMRSASYIGLRSTTKAGYGSRIEALRIDHGHRTVAGLSRERIITGVLQPFSDRPGSAHGTLKMLRILIRHAVDIGWLTHDPSLGIKRPKMQEIRSWTDAEIVTFENRWPIASKQRLAFALMLYTGRGDPTCIG